MNVVRLHKLSTEDDITSEENIFNNNSEIPIKVTENMVNRVVIIC